MKSNNFKDWSHVIVKDHKAALKKAEIAGKKLLGEYNKTERVQKLLEKRFEAAKSIIQSDRVEIRNERCIGTWLSDTKLVKLREIVGCLQTFGFENENGKFLYPEEALLLMETNRLELLNDNIPMSIQEAYDILLENSSNLRKFVIYKKIAAEGIEVRKSKANTLEPDRKRIKLAEDSSKDDTTPFIIKEPKSKLKKGARKSKNRVKLDEKSNEKLKACLNEVKANGPKQFVTKVDQDSDYRIVLDGATKLDLHISESPYVPTNLGFLNTNTPAIVNLPTAVFSGYFHFANVNIPDLP